VKGAGRRERRWEWRDAKGSVRDVGGGSWGERGSWVGRGWELEGVRGTGWGVGGGS